MVLQLLFLEQPLQILHVVVFEVFDEAAGRLETLLDGEAGGFVPEHTQHKSENTQPWHTKPNGPTTYKHMQA